MSLNAAQSEAVETLSGPLLVLAGAGTGKTRVVTYRIVRLIRSGIPADRILAVTFTNKAAREMQSRISRQIGNLTEKKPEISTFHSLCVRILRRQIHHLGFPNQFSIYDRGDQESIARQILRDVRIAGGAVKPSDFLYQISQWKSAGILPDTAMSHPESAREYLIAVAYNRYQMALKTLGAVDFDDLLIHTEELFKQFPNVLLEESQRFDHLLIDEYQDTNMIQYRIVRGLALPHRNICAVGDDDQAIYGWRGAEVTHILNFKKDWPEAKIIRLENNYRSTSQIIDWANRLIVFNTQRHDKKLRAVSQGPPPQILQCRDGEAEAKTVVSLIRRRMQEAHLQPRDFAILFRTNEQPRAFEMELRAMKIPYSVVGSQSFFDRKEVKDIISWLKVLVRPQDNISLLRIINTPPRGIGGTTIRKITEAAISAQKSDWEILGDPEKFGIHLETGTRTAVETFRQLVQTERARFKKSFSTSLFENFIEKIGYKREIERAYPDLQERENRLNSLGEVVSAVSAYLTENPQGTLRDFLDNTVLGEPDFGSDKSKKDGKNAVVLLTYHAAKGLEFPEVYMVGMEEGLLPHQRSIDDFNMLAVEEERRLCYVGITRSQRRLTLTMALNRQKWGKMRPTLPSRFLYEVTGQADNPHYDAIQKKKWGKKTGKPGDCQK